MEAEQHFAQISTLLKEYASHDEARDLYTQPLPWREFHDQIGKLWADSQDHASNAAN